MNKYFTIKYEIEGNKRIDEIMIWSNNIKNAIEEFENTEIYIGNGINIKYNQYAIKEIKG